MKILNEENGRIVRCEDCDTKIQYEKEDIKYGEFGIPYLKCPVCNKNIDLYDEEDLKLDFNNIEYPTHFYHFDGKKGVEIDNKQINIWIKELLNRIKKENKNYDFMCSGNTMVFIIKDKSGYNMFVCPNYYEGHIFREDLKEEESDNEKKCSSCEKYDCAEKEKSETIKLDTLSENKKDKDMNDETKSNTEKSKDDLQRMIDILKKVDNAEEEKSKDILSKAITDLFNIFLN
jgi:hypothetical protein